MSIPLTGLLFFPRPSFTVFKSRSELRSDETFIQRYQVTWKPTSGGRQRLRIGADVHCEEGVKARGTWAYLRDRSPGECLQETVLNTATQKRQGPMTGVEGIWTLCPVALHRFPGLASAYPTPCHLVCAHCDQCRYTTSIPFQLGNLGSRQNFVVLRTEPACPLWAGVETS